MEGLEDVGQVVLRQLVEMSDDGIQFVDHVLLCHLPAGRTPHRLPVPSRQSVRRDRPADPQVQYALTERIVECGTGNEERIEHKKINMSFYKPPSVPIKGIEEKNT